ncbi:MAG: MarR family transcriptional regulator [Candidatus Thorarchaeota archaeon]
MTLASLKSYPRFVSFCVNLSEWLGLQRNAGMALATLYIAKGTDYEKMSAEDIAKITGYSRSNVSLVLSQLEALDLVESENDDAQTGRGRKRILYSVGGKVTSPISFAISKIVGQLEELSTALKNIEDAPNNKPDSLLKTIEEFKREAEIAFTSLAKNR